MTNTEALACARCGKQLHPRANHRMSSNPYSTEVTCNRCSKLPVVLHRDEAQALLDVRRTLETDENGHYVVHPIAAKKNRDSYHEHGDLLIVIRCPICGHRHCHGAPRSDDGTYALGHRVPHCDSGFRGDYVIAQPSAEVLEAIQ